MNIFLWIILAIFLIILASNALKVIRPYQRGVVERLGKYVRTLGSGLNVIIPAIEKIEKVDMRENVIDVPPQEVITKDNVLVTVDAVIYYEVTDPFRVLYNVSNFTLAATKLAQTNLRNIVGDLELDQTLTSREMINTKLREVLDEATDKWGVKVTRVEIQKIDPPHDITEAMSRQMKAERTKRAAILEAEGIKQSEILKAEGTKQAAILQAEGNAEAIMKVADAEKYRLSIEADGQAEATIKVFNSIHQGQPTKDLIAIRYLDALKNIADGKASKLFIPYESSAIIGSLAEIAEIFKKDDNIDKGENINKEEG
ncbi:MAG TPA: SPFH domain-containing protein [Caldisericia bacterium]|jgi:regulator of protease activity HflC (stomatin/prohibitin superfamily)|nr:SPFH/Band 7/PHB domain protein [Caldisericia bacterium]HOW02932.1 SPFH domain-containing protein [Caldisericia bacterium]HPO29121.1 SPFH domain-containing protein [Caldisericia bacterium]HQG81951.1 SPFH domain-containing protein [Caldisericia bacterium]HXK70150.1 SPFH domain-containing protein [Caldisericia bacterium]